LYGIVVVECGISPEYFLDEMQMYEIDACLAQSFRRHKQAWEIGRFNAYMIYCANSKNRKQITDFMPLPWELGINTELEDAERERIKEILKNATNKCD
jgi:hypothetical protein